MKSIKHRKILVRILVLAAVLAGAMLLMSGCGSGGQAGGENAPAVSESGEPAGTILAEDDGEVTVVDQAGR